MNVRTTTQTQIGQALANIRLQSGSIARLQGQIATGVKVARPSDDPDAFARIYQNKAAAERYDGYLGTMAEATSTLDAGVSALQQGNNLLVRAKQIAQEGANGTTDQSASEALASELDTIIERMIDVANTRVEGRNLFGGTDTRGPAFTVTGTDPAGRPAVVDYVGSDERGKALVGQDHTVDTRYSGRGVFQSPGADVFESLIGLRDDLRNSSLTGQARADAISTRIGQVDAARERIGVVMGTQASTLANLETMATRATDMKIAGTIRATELEATDYSDAIMNLQSQENLFQATLAMSARILQPSLMDFLQ